MVTNNLYVIAAICGNFYRESQVNPGIWENLTVGAPGYGLGQWTDIPPSLTRRTQLFQWLSANGYSQDSGEGQLSYLVYENYWIPNNRYHNSAYATLADYLQSTSTNLSDLVYEYMWHWEGINDSQVSIRLQYAQRFLDLMLNDPGYRMPWTAINAYISVTQSEFNVLLIMDWFLGSTPPGPGPGPSEDGTYYALFQMALKRRKKGGWNIV